ncbi:TPA: hypothetical protein NH684_002295 [Pseudomonas aeruginosa]|uniref:hypothetical protein n=1 Tax=Pseudomonas aeruginosa TaxID=287 RepID=UPI00053E3CFF|nr:hypothetical protein [Pseudomonas aeruginosa]EMC2524068.1 hypothetical protein [Pseudomonas aeruginosa]MBA5208018.1 hypothetical protein [Pseudomonas aeruginosa]MBG4574068.1 hypothetical protein [Pseudomonas aeruginosa]MBM9966672.1 hypothetical protein [Pseudomonas aeruginosa]MBN0096860.1 hypothetical protein [Pseudomonas aeruginosa]
MKYIIWAVAAFLIGAVGGYWIFKSAPDQQVSRAADRVQMAGPGEPGSLKKLPSGRVVMCVADEPHWQLPSSSAAADGAPAPNE